MNKDKIIEKLRLDQRAWLRVYQLAKSRIIAIDSYIKAFQKKKKGK